MEKTRVLFLCTGNSARSQMAEAFLRKVAGDRFEVYSAGLEPKAINPFTIQVMQEVDIDVSGQRSKHLDEYLGKKYFQYLITVCDDADRNCPTVLEGVLTRQHWSIPDPSKATGSAEQKLIRFRQVRDLINARVKDWLAEQGI